MAEKPPDNRQADAFRDQIRGVGMSIIMDSIVFDLGSVENRPPEFLQVNDWLPLDLARKQESGMRVSVFLHGFQQPNSPTAAADNGRCSVRFCFV